MRERSSRPDPISEVRPIVSSYDTDVRLPSSSEWQARWIEPSEPGDGPEVHRPAYHLAGEFIIEAPVVSARIRATAHGIYEVFLNGSRIGDVELAPGFTAYRKRIQVHTFDVTRLVVEGANALGALLSDGWWRGQHGIVRAIDPYGATTAFLAELHIALRSGETIVFGTDGSWRSAPSHILAADLIAGEIHDLRRLMKGWAHPGTDRSSWDTVRVVDHGYVELCAAVGPPTRRVEELPALSVTELAPNHHVVDFGQNSNGWARLTDLGPEGTTITVTYGEALDPVTGDVTQDNIKNAGATAAHHVPLPFQTDVVTSAGDGAVFEPRHSTKGYQYIRIEGHPGPLDPRSISSIVVHSDLQRIGGFACSDERINRLHRIAVWSFRGNACDIPTDCPTRERSGWVGDWQLYVDTAAYLYDVFDFSVKWLHDLAADQLSTGAVTNIVPDPSPDARIWKNGHASSGWGDAAVHVPWELYRATGRTDVLTDQLESMERWVDFAAGRALRGRHPSRVERNPDPLPHEQFLWDSGWHFGEWLEPGTDMDVIFRRLLVEDHGPVATAYLHRSARELAAIAAVLDDDEAAGHYGELAANVRDAWRTEFIDEKGHVQPATQANLVRALAFELVPEDLRSQTADDLVTLIRAADTHLSTGFLATPFLLPVLADTGHLEVAYELLFQDTEPSWLRMTESGTTTIWEDWDAVKPDGTVSHSLNHYSKGAVIAFLHRYVAGLQLVEPGYRRFRVAPHPGGGISWAETHHDCPHGPIGVRWEQQQDRLDVTVNVPPGTSADVVLPNGDTHTLTEGRHTIST
jgi:alpha-L-rhamnosidase